MAPTFSSIPEKLRNRIRPNSVGCWVWTGAEYAGGYGGAWWKGKKWRVHLHAVGGSNYRRYARSSVSQYALREPEAP